MTDSQFFPHFICRVAGVPVGGLEDLVAVESVTSCRALRESEAELGQLRDPLSEAIFEAVGGLEAFRRAVAAPAEAEPVASVAARDTLAPAAIL